MDTPSTSPDAEHPIPVVVHLSGKLRGTTERLSGQRLKVGTAPEAEVHFPADHEPEVADNHATLSRRGDTYVLHTEPGQAVYVNGERAETLELHSGDILEVGPSGPLLRFRLYEPGSAAYKSMSEAFADCMECARHGSGSSLGRAGAFVAGLPREVATHTSPGARIGVGLLMVALIVTVGYLLQYGRSLEQRLTEQLEQQSRQVEGIAEILELTERNALRPEDLARLRRELEESVTEAADRLETLEARAGAGKRVISNAVRSVVFLQGAYGFDDSAGRPLRLGLGPDGRPLVDPRGNPLLTTEGEGPPLEAMYTGTAFVATEDGLLFTNKHVALPWEFEPAARRLESQGFTPVMRRFVGYLPEVGEPFDVELVAAGDDADLAVLRCSNVTGRVPPLELREAPAEAGDEVIILGFPTGIQALLARADESFVAALAKESELDFWGVARRLAKAGHIGPLASRGIVGQTTSAYVVYDAETTSGGSGGPVLDLEGRVAAVNAAIIPQFGGSNLGVPAAKARELLAAAGAGEPPAAEPALQTLGDSEVDVARP